MTPNLTCLNENQLATLNKYWHFSKCLRPVHQRSDLKINLSNSKLCWSRTSTCNIAIWKWRRKTQDTMLINVIRTCQITLFASEEFVNNFTLNLALCSFFPALMTLVLISLFTYLGAIIYFCRKLSRVSVFLSCILSLNFDHGSSMWH